MVTNGRKRYFHIDENASSEQIYAKLDDVKSAVDVDILMNDSDIEFIAKEEITQAASTHDISLVSPEANLHIVPSDNQSKKKKRIKKKHYGSGSKKLKLPSKKSVTLIEKKKKKECHLVLEIQPNLNEAISSIEIFSLGIGLEELLQLIVEQSNIHAHQK